MALLNPYRFIAQTLNLIIAVRHDEHCYTVLLDELVNAILAFPLEHEVADRQNLIHDKNFRHNNRGNCKRDTRNHTRRIVFHRHVEKLLDFRKFDNLIEMFVDKLLGIAQQCAIQINIFASSELHVEARTKLDERRDVAVHRAGAPRRLQNARDNLQHGRFARSVRA